MREYRSADGEQRLWYDPGEIDQLVEDELRRANLMPTVTKAATNLEAFVESYLHCPLDQYRPLPAEVLGVTEFVRGKPPTISLNQDLTGAALDDEDAAPGQVGRWRATLAHEACHVLLHRTLFEFDENQGEMFPETDEGQQRLQRCLKRDVGHARWNSDWREVQANQGMAALLMPRKLFGRVVRAAANDLGIGLTGLQEGSRDAVALSGILAWRFDVSRQAALIRLKTTEVIADGSTPVLGPL